jgi:excisionase family DNA binding protein
MTVKEFALYINVGEQTVRRWIRDGYISCMKIGGIVRICESTTDAFQETAKTQFLLREDEVSE